MFGTTICNIKGSVKETKKEINCTECLRMLNDIKLWIDKITMQGGI